MSPKFLTSKQKRQRCWSNEPAIYCPVVHRKDQAEKNAEQNFYLANDNKDCIQVKGEVGLTNLWQRHLTKLPSITLESAEAIIANYPMPSKLVQVSAENEY